MKGEGGLVPAFLVVVGFEDVAEPSVGEADDGGVEALRFCGGGESSRDSGRGFAGDSEEDPVADLDGGDLGLGWGEPSDGEVGEEVVCVVGGGEFGMGAWFGEVDWFGGEAGQALEGAALGGRTEDFVDESLDSLFGGGWRSGRRAGGFVGGLVGDGKARPVGGRRR